MEKKAAHEDRFPHRKEGGENGPNEFALSRIVAGAWRMKEWGTNIQDRVHWIENCLGLGITSFDHADIYGDYGVEALFGEALKKDATLRRRMQIVTKCGIKLVSSMRPAHRIKSYDTSRRHVMESVESSLRALNTDYIDLLLIHRPDALMDVNELAETFSALQREGKVLHFGVSNHSASQFALLNGYFPLATHQIEFSPLHLTPLFDGTLDQCIGLGIQPMLWSPLGGGQLFTSREERVISVRKVLEALSNSYGVSIGTMAYAWLLRHPVHPIPITGSGRLEGLKDAVAALSVEMTREEWYSVLQASEGREVP